jgi:Rhodopirellula transposase DDE domain
MESIIQRDITLKILETLNEAQTRWFVARDAMLLGHGGIKKMCELSGLSKPTVIKGIKELKSKKNLCEGGRIRQPGGGRKKIEEKAPEILKILKEIMDETTAGDPMGLLKWTSKSTYKIRDQLKGMGYSISEDTVGRRLKEMGYSLQANVKTWEGVSHKNRDSQFQYINNLAKKYVNEGNPVISVDAKKREIIGNFKNSGKKWRPKGSPKKVNVYDYPSLSEGKAIPYGTYDIQKNKGMVNVGISHDTAEFAVESIRRWWFHFGYKHYPKAKRILICADCGGSNGYRNRAWKYNLQKLSDEIPLSITVCHYPPGTSKWNKIEHRMFSFISMNWRGEPLVNFETVINLISSTITKNGLGIKALLDTEEYETGKKISDDQMKKINLTFHKTNPKWNYTITPKKAQGNIKK